MHIELQKSTDGQSYPRIGFPNGARKRVFPLTPSRAIALKETNFEHWTILGNYYAIWDKHSKSVEVYVSALHEPTAWVIRERLSKLAGFQEALPPSIQEGLFASAVDLFPSVDTTARRRDQGPWKLPLRSEKFDAEISNASAAILAVTNRHKLQRQAYNTASIKIFGVTFANHDQALSATEELVRSLLFDLDLCFGIALDLLRFDSIEHLSRSHEYSMHIEPRLPERRYSHAATSLYLFGRSARRMPLQQYLSYYQTLEYFFPAYWERDLLRRLKAELSDPRFRVEDTHRLSRIIQMVKSSGGRSGVPERDQLNAVISECVTERDLRDFIVGDQLKKDALTDKKLLTGIPPLPLADKNRPIWSQVTERVYAIRCRIVHGKEDGAGDFSPPLLPFSDEETRLGHDIDLVRFLAEQVIIASSTSDGWWN